MKQAGFEDVKPADERHGPDHYEFKLGSSTGSIAFQGREAIHFHVTNDPQRWEPPSAQERYNRNYYLATDMPAVLGIIANHIKNKQQGTKSPNA